MKRLITPLIFLIGICNLVNAQAPLSVPYQAVARDAAGNLISNQLISLRFSVHDVTATGTVVYKETQSVTTNKLGLFNVSVGLGTVVSGTFSGIGWGAGAKYLQVELDPTGGSSYISMGTSQMQSVPFALYAASGGTAQVNSDWNALSGVTQILNKPAIPVFPPAGGTTSQYINGVGGLVTFPSIPAGQVNSDWAAVSGVSQILNKPVIPSNTNQLTNGSGFISLSSLSANLPATYNNATGAIGVLYDNSSIKLNGSNQLYAPNTGTVTSVATGAGLTGGPFTGSGTISLANGTIAGQVFVTGATPFTPTLQIMSGDATIASNGALTLKSTGTAGTYTKVTTDAQGRVTAGASPTTLAGYGITDAAPLTGGTGYIQNQNAAAQASSNFWISGSGTFAAGAAINLTGTGSGTYNRTVIYNDAPDGGLYIDLARATDLVTATPYNLHVDARGGGANFFHIQGSTGDVGIGTASPAYTLDVNGIARATEFIGAGQCYEKWGSWGCSSGYNDVLDGRTGGQESFEGSGDGMANIVCVSSVPAAINSWGFSSISGSTYRNRLMRATSTPNSMDRVQPRCSICCKGGCYTAFGVSTCFTGYTAMYTGRTGGVEAYTAGQYQQKTLCIDGSATVEEATGTYGTTYSTRLMRHREGSGTSYDNNGMDQVPNVCAVCCRQ